MQVIATQGALFGEEKVFQCVTREMKKPTKELELTSPQEQFLFGVEKALGFRRVEDAAGQAVLDSRGLTLLRVDRRRGTFKGQFKAKDLTPFLREALMISCLSKATSRIAPLFEEHENERLVREGLSLLTHRLRAMRGEDCPKLITDVFIEHYAQQDLMMNERTGETLRNNHRLANAEARRRAAGVKARNFRKSRTVQGVEAEEPIVAVESDSDAPKVIKLTVERLLGKRHESDEVYASDDSAELTGKTDNSFILEED